MTCVTSSGDHRIACQGHSVIHDVASDSTYFEGVMYNRINQFLVSTIYIPG